MRKQLTIVFTCLLGLLLTSLYTHANIYIIYYATSQGKTGHMGIAVDNYKIIYREIESGGNTREIADTVATGELTYYDLWPSEDHFSLAKTGEDIPPLYFKLPVSSTGEITINMLYDAGIPHREFYPCDGILSIPGSWLTDQSLRTILDSMITLNRPFNASRFNCADFVKLALEKLLNLELESSEFVLTGWSTTPNKLYSKLVRLTGVKVIKDAGKKAEGSFIGEKIIHHLFAPATPRSTINLEN